MVRSEWLVGLGGGGWRILCTLSYFVSFRVAFSHFVVRMVLLLPLLASVISTCRNTETRERNALHTKQQKIITNLI